MRTYLLLICLIIDENSLLPISLLSVCCCFYQFNKEKYYVGLLYEDHFKINNIQIKVFLDSLFIV